VEVDFVIELEGKTIGIEVKNSDDLQSNDLEGLREFHKLLGDQDPSLYVFHMGRQERKFGTVRALPWQKGLKAIGL
jgi:predicted AAA+ superfamily ATPase